MSFTHCLDDCLNWMGTQEKKVPLVLEILILGWYNLAFCMIGPPLSLFILLETKVWRAFESDLIFKYKIVCISLSSLG